MNSAQPSAQADPSLRLDILAPDLGRGGWGPIQRMVQLAASTVPARVVEAGSRPVTRLSKLRLLRGRPRPRPQQRGSERHLLVIAPLPGSLDALLTLPNLREYSTISGWVIDSFWHERIPRIVRARGWYDRLYVMDEDDVAAWSGASGVPVSALPWATDTRAARETMAAKSTDLLRVGRQPAAWDDDARTAEAAREHGLTFQGRPGFGSTEEESQRLLHAELASARAVLAFTNLSSPADYTHPTRDYLTGRWADALGHGCVMVGQVPGSASARQLVPAWAQLTVPANSLARGMGAIAEAAPSWDDALHDRIRAHAREHLDWRHRFAVIARDLGLEAPVIAGAPPQHEG